MQLQRTVTKSAKAALFYDLVELLTGLYLVGFLFSHLIFESSIVLGKEVFNNLSRALDENYLPYIGIPLTVIVFFTHFLAAGRRIPTGFEEQRIIWQHARMLRHFNTWTWLVQVVSGMVILILGSIHMWIVITGWPIEAGSSAARVQSGYIWFYILLLLSAGVHAGVGLYRQFVKWGWFPRKPVGILVGTASALIIILGFLTLLAFVQLGGIS
ncbi:fumarate reductase subunit C [Desulfohalotomaculum tongense]|uniref:succinate dehydrogenase n=1 Tax=Desulforadius tongensis TaxID=1216062 RepID=UPI00195CFEC9|nr:succinate dehydrogenase [Desulforadius tongensis]MBM7854127.1 fumarate reductase subunit C [Desulforadius tongensis]